MKKVLIILTTLFLFACASDDQATSPVIDLEIGNGGGITAKRLQNTIASKGEVDVYRLNVVEANRILQIRCTGPVMANVDFLVHVFETDGGVLRRIAGDHAVEDGIEEADIRINVAIDRPKELIVHVRDLKDDNASSTENYYISADYLPAEDGNSSFETAEPITVGGEALRDSIGSVGDSDVFTFTTTEDGVYDVQILFDSMTGTSVNLSVELFDENGLSIENTARNMGASKEAHMLHYLEAGKYNLLVQDHGQNDFDNASFYTVDVSSVTVAEINVDDTFQSASSSVPAAPAVGYYKDEDWYQIDYQDGGTLNILEFDFSSDVSIRYQLSLYQLSAPDNVNETAPLYSHTYSGGDSGTTFRAVLKLEDPGDANYYMVIKAADGSQLGAVAGYTSSISLTNVTDPDEAGAGNNLDTNAVDITNDADQTHQGNISYRTDVDWYVVEVPFAAEDRILSFDLDIPSNPNVEYVMDIKRSVRDNEAISYGLTKRVFHGSRDHRTADLKTGFIVPAQSAGSYTHAYYYVKISDLQGDDGENQVFTLKWQLDPIPDSVLTVPAGSGITGHQYNDEKDERGNEVDYTAEVIVDYGTGDSGVFKANTSLLGSAKGTRDGNTVTFPWITGYIDYQGDEDWYGLDLGMPLDQSDSQFYYTINIEMYAEGSDVEYTWQYFPDSDNNGQVHVERCASSARHCSGYQAGEGDLTVASDSVHTVFPGSGSSLWHGSGDERSVWRTCVEEVDGVCNEYTGMVYFRISDFNYFFLETDVVNPVPDDDWGHDKPYFFRVVLTYHNEDAHPPQNN